MFYQFKTFLLKKMTNKHEIMHAISKSPNMLNFVYVECSSGYFGLGCNKRCIGHCMNNEACDHVSGFCLRGCMDGYIGQHCNICKICTKLKKMINVF